MPERFEEQFTRYEVARILGARSLQLAMDAPILLKLSDEEIEKLNYDNLRIAERELEEGVLPITVRRPLPKKSDKEVKKLSKEEIEEKLEKEKEKEKEKILERIIQKTRPNSKKDSQTQPKSRQSSKES